MPISPGAPLGNHHRAKGKRFQQALLRALARHSGISADDGMEKIAAEMVKNALKGDSAAAKDIADRIDGKPAQELNGPGGGPLQLMAFTPEQLADLPDDRLERVSAAISVLAETGLVEAPDGGGGGAAA